MLIEIYEMLFLKIDKGQYCYKRWLILEKKIKNAANINGYSKIDI